MKIGIDLDKTITLYGFWSRKAVVKKMQAMKERGYQFVIVTRRPRRFFCFWFTKRLLIFYHVPFESLDCVGFGKGTNERKLKVIKEKKIEVFIDNDRRVVEFMQRNSVKAARSLDYLN